MRRGVRMMDRLSAVGCAVRRRRPTMCLDGDGFYTFNALERFRKVCRTSGAVFSYVDKDPKPVFSYVQIEGAEFGANTITCIREKEKVSDYANTGARARTPTRQASVRSWERRQVN